MLTLSHGNVTPSLEHHHRDGASWKAVPNDQLSNDVEADLLIRDSLNHSDRNNIEEGYHECEDEPLTSKNGNLERKWVQIEIQLTLGTWFPRPRLK